MRAGQKVAFKYASSPARFIFLRYFYEPQRRSKTNHALQLLDFSVS